MSDDLNPYAAPAGPAVASGEPAAYWNPEQWEVGEIIGRAWELFMRDWAALLVSVLVGIGMILLPVGVLFGYAFSVLPRNGGAHPPPGFFAIMGCCYVALVALGQLVQAGWLAVFTASARGESPNLQVFFSGMPRFLAIFAEALLYGLITMAGLLCLIVPGFVLAIGLSLTQYFVAEGMGPIDALRASWKATMGEKSKLLLLYLALFLILIAGEMACGVGLLIAGPVVMLARALVFVRMTGRMGSAQMQGIGNSQGI